MSQLAGDVAAVLDALGFAQVHYNPAGERGRCPGMWGPRMKAVREANSLEPIAETSMDRF
jgi:hypothetical protein